MKTKRPYDVTGNIISYEQGELSGRATLTLFSHLIESGMINHLQGHYGRTAQALIDDNWLDRKGTINKTKLKDNGL